MITRTIFSVKAIEYLTTEMNICVDDLTNKILLDIPNNHMFFKNLIDFIIDLKIPNEYEIDSFMSWNNDENREFINDQMYNFLEDNGLDENSKEHFIFDNIRHAFINFKQGGILNMYHYREAEVWYPKVIINKFIGNVEDIKELDDEIIIYRGTSKEEYNSSIFGQSWSINQKVAYDFAFVHYRGQVKYINTHRIILKTKIKKELIYYFAKNGRENEVIIDSQKLLIDEVSIIETKTI